MMAQCCDNFQWTSVCNLPHVEGCDFDLGRCASCGRDVISVYNAYSPAADPCTYIPVAPDIAQDLLRLPPGPARKEYLRAWFDEKE